MQASPAAADGTGCMEIMVAVGFFSCSCHHIPARNHLDWRREAHRECAEPM